MAEFLPPTTDLKKRQDPRGTFVYYPGEDGDWYWKYVASNGREVYRSSEGYKNKADCVKSIPRCSQVESAFRVDLTA